MPIGPSARGKACAGIACIINAYGGGACAGAAVGIAPLQRYILVAVRLHLPNDARALGVITIGVTLPHKTRVMTFDNAFELAKIFLKNQCGC